MTAELHRVLPGFAHDDAFLDLVMGVHVAFARLDEVLARHAPEGDHAEDDAPDELILPVLGLIALRERVARALASVPPHRSPDHPPRSTDHESLLR